MDSAMYKSDHARAICEVTNSGLVRAVSPMTLKNRSDAFVAVPRARRSMFCALMNEFALLIGQLARTRPFETSSQSLHVPVCQNSSDIIPLNTEMLLSEIWNSPSAPAATAGRRTALFAASLVNACGFWTARMSLHPVVAARTAATPAHRAARLFK